MNKTPVKIPLKLAHFADPKTRPIHISSGDVEKLLRYWGFSKGKSVGQAGVNKLVKCGTIEPVKQNFTKNRLFDTERILKLYHDFTCC